MRGTSVGFLLIGLLLIAGTFALLRAKSKRAEAVSKASPSPRQLTPALSAIDATADSDAIDSASTEESSSLARPGKLPEGIVGTATCAECHPAQFDSYRETDHSRSLVAWSPDAGVPLEGFTHAKSRTVYTAFEDAGQLYHREELEIPTGSMDAEHALFPTGMLPVKYVMGSGAFAHAYLLEDGEYLLQSPMTWYVKPQRYEIAPGYDETHHPGLTRVVSTRCLYCHAGSLSAPTGNEQNVTIYEEAISCERCHGPGEQHTQLYQTADASDENASDEITGSLIVHPGNLSRDLADAICAQCHLQGDVVVEQAGKSDWDYRPGEPLDSTMISYKSDDEEVSKETFVGHFDQIWQSKCYTQSETLKCISCHDPHHKPTNENIDAVERQYCIQCHQHAECGLPLQERIEQENDRCVSCHMPPIASEVAHAATTHHTIGIHRRGKDSVDADQNASVAANEDALNNDAMSMVLRRMRSPIEEVSADEHKTRNDLLARAMQLIKIDIREPGESSSSSSLPSAPLRDLIAYAKQNPSDMDVLVHIAALARWEAEWLLVNPSENSEQASAQRWRVAGPYAERVLRSEARPNENRRKALDVLFDVHYAAERYADAVHVGRELVAATRSEMYQYNLGLAFGKLRRFPEAESAFKESIRIDGRYLKPYRSLIKLYQAVDRDLANQVRRSATAIQANLESK